MEGAGPSSNKQSSPPHARQPAGSSGGPCQRDSIIAQPVHHAVDIKVEEDNPATHSMVHRCLPSAPLPLPLPPPLPLPHPPATAGVQNTLQSRALLLIDSLSFAVLVLVLYLCT